MGNEYALTTYVSPNLEFVKTLPMNMHHQSIQWWPPMSTLVITEQGREFIHHHGAMEDERHQLLGIDVDKVL